MNTIQQAQEKLLERINNENRTLQDIIEWGEESKRISIEFWKRQEEFEEKIKEMERERSI